MSEVVELNGNDWEWMLSERNVVSLLLLLSLDLVGLGMLMEVLIVVLEVLFGECCWRHMSGFVKLKGPRTGSKWSTFITAACLSNGSWLCEVYDELIVSAKVRD